MRRALKIIAFPLAVLAVFGLLYAIWRLLDLPPEETLAQIASEYGPWLYALLVAVTERRTREEIDGLAMAIKEALA